MVNKQTNMTFRFALSLLESHFDSTYRGIKTVTEMNTERGLGMYWENEDDDTVYHQFETRGGNDRVVRDDQVIPLAESIFELSTVA